MAVKTKTEVQVNEVKDQTDGTSEVQAKEIKDKAEVNIAEINKSLGKYSLPEYNERIYSTVYYQLRSAIGWTNLGIAKNKEMYFDWKEFKAEYKKTFGTLEERKYPLEVLLEYAQTMLGKSLNDLLIDSKISWARRNQQQEEENN